MSGLGAWLLGRLSGDDGLPAPEGFEGEGGVFVEVRVRGELRAFLGTLEVAGPFPDRALELARRALADDPRFAPIAAGEGEAVTLRVWRTAEARRVDSPEALRPGVDGVYVRRGFHRAALLPGLDAGDEGDPTTLLENACIAAGLGPEDWQAEDTEVTAFEVREVG